MIVHIPHTFEEIFFKTFKQHHFQLEDFCHKLKQHSPIHIAEPIYKVKIILNGVALRGLIVKKNNTTIIPLLFFLKDSKEGYNLILDKKTTPIINKLLAHYEQDFQNKRFVTY